MIASLVLCKSVNALLYRSLPPDLHPLALIARMHTAQRSEGLASRQRLLMVLAPEPSAVVVDLQVPLTPLCSVQSCYQSLCFASSATCYLNQEKASFVSNGIQMFRLTAV